MASGGPGASSVLFGRPRRAWPLVGKPNRPPKGLPLP